MKKKISQCQDVKQTSQSSYQLCKLCQSPYGKKSNSSLFQTNYQLIARTINQKMEKATNIGLISKIVQRQPSKDLINFQEIQKNLQVEEYLKHYYGFEKIFTKIKVLIQKHIPNVKANYMDFKIKNFLILNKYKVTQRCNLPYPLSKFQKQTDSKMSSTKSVQNKVLQQLQKQKKQKKISKSPPVQIFKSPNKKIHKTKKYASENFEIKQLTKNIGQMIQNIKDNRTLDKFKKEMEMSCKLNCGVVRLNEKEVGMDKIKQTKKKKDADGQYKEQRQANIKYLKEKQFKRKIQNDMCMYFPEDKDKSTSVRKKTSKHTKSKEYIFLVKCKSKQKFNYNSTERLLTNPIQDTQQYGLSIIRQKRKKSKQNKSKSKQLSRKSKQSLSIYQLSSGRRLETEYQSSSTQRLNTEYSALAKSKSSSRITTQYESTVIVRDVKSKSKSKNQNDFQFSSFNKNKQKSNSTRNKDTERDHYHKKSHSKSKPNLLQFKSPGKGL